MLQGQQTASNSISSRASIGTQADRHLLHLHRMSYVISKRTPLLLPPPPLAPIPFTIDRLVFQRDDKFCRRI